MVAKRTTSRAVKRVAKGVTAYGASGGSQLLLDQYSGAAAAYSLRKLRSNYTGSAIRVRRSSDSAEQDIGFTSAGDLDESALTTFCGAGDGFVTTWYDQQGSNNATQTTAASQPKIVTSGSVLQTNALPSLLFDGTDDRLLADSVAASFTGEDKPISTISVSQPSVSNVFQHVFSIGTDGIAPLILPFRYTSSADINMFRRDDVNVGKAITAGAYSGGTQYLHGAYSSGTDLDFYQNGSQLASAADWDVGTQSLTRFTIGTLRRNADQDFMNGTIQELVLYASDESANRAGMEANVKAYWNVY